MNKLTSNVKKNAVKVVSGLNVVLCTLILTTSKVYALESNTSSIDTFITFVCDWLVKIGGVVMLIGGVMFALSWQRDDAEGKSRALMTLMAGGMVAGIGVSKGLFGL
jgi:fumarate reductase subunit C